MEGFVMPARSHEISEEDAETTVRNLKAAVRATFSGPGLVANYHTIAFHMMMTFYLLLVVMAIAPGQEGKSPSLMSFILLWHLVAIPVWLLRKLTLRVCREPLGMLVGFVVFAIALLALQDPLTLALANLINWIKSAPGELLQYFNG
jgi:hypothetical protein